MDLAPNSQKPPQKRTTDGQNRWTCGMLAGFLCSVIVASPAWAALYAHRQWSDNSIFEMITHCVWHINATLWVYIAIRALVRWLTNTPTPWHWKLLNTLVLLPPPLYLSSVTSPWTALRLYKLPLHKLSTTTHPSTNPQERLSIFSWNIFLGNQSTDELLQTIEDAQADIVVLIELTPEHTQNLRPLRNSYPHSYWFPRTNTRGLAVLTKFPQATFEVLNLADEGYPAIAAHIPSLLAPNESTHLLALHTASPNLDSRFLSRDKQLKAAGTWANNQPGDVVIIGDLNITPWSPPFLKLLESASLKDSRNFRGYFATWPTGLGILGIPIDHALLSSRWNVIDRQVGFPSLASDHQWLKLELEKPAPSNN
jgi:endonuclease/exonuclease/phosphatase (EEP) superfamily protein YafD